MARMFFSAIEFLDEEREGWRPFEALDGLTDAQLEVPVAAAHGWSGRDLIVHLVAWQELLLEVARELAVNDDSPTLRRIELEWEADPDAVNAQMLASWRSRSTDEVRQRLRTVPGELRGYLTVVPEIRWLKRPDRLEWFLDGTAEHYPDHASDLAAILGLAGPP